MKKAKTKKSKSEITMDDLIREITDILSEWDGEDIVNLYNEKIGTRKAEFTEDGIVLIED